MDVERLAYICTYCAFFSALKQKQINLGPGYSGPKVQMSVRGYLTFVSQVPWPSL